MKRTAHILTLSVLLLTAAFSSILQFPYVTHAQTESAAVLDAPTLTADDTKANRVELSWSAVDGAARYELLRWEEGADDWIQLDDALTQTVYIDSDVEARKTYYYTVRALTADGVAGAWSDHESEDARATVDAAAEPTSTPTQPVPTVTPTQADAEQAALTLTAPTLTAQADATQANTVKLSWTPLSGAVRYALWAWWDGLDDWQRLDDGSLTGTSYTHENLAAGTTYYYTIAAVDADGVGGAYSERVDATTAAALTTSDGKALASAAAPASADEKAPAAQASSDGASSDRAALVALYEATNGANWTNKTNWLSAEPVSAWHGVSTDADGRVTRLLLGSNGLRGAIPAELGNLTNLEILDLRINALRGAIPAELGNLTNLRFLLLLGNQLNGAIPLELGNLINLEGLLLDHNQLRGAIPAELGNLTKLTSLSLGANQLSGCVPDGLRNVANNDLDSLDLPLCSAALAAAERDALMALYEATNGAGWTNKDNWDSEQPVGEWHGVTTNDNGRVTRLLLSSNGLRGAIPAALGSLTNLEILDLRVNALRGEIPAELGNLTNLRFLLLLRNQLNGAIPLELGKLTNLEGLLLDHNQLSGAIPVELGNLTKLTSLSLGANQLSGCVPNGLRDVASNDLDSLDLPFCSALASSDRAALMALYKATNGAGWTNKDNWDSDKPVGEWHGVTTDTNGSVTDLDLSGNGLRGKIPAAALGKLTNLARLDLSGNGLRGKIPAALGKLTNLARLDLSGNGLRGEIPAALGKLTNLARLDLHNNALSDAIPAELGKLTKLTRLSLGGNQLRGKIPAKLGKLTKLTRLSLGGNQLRGCVPDGLREVANNDLDSLGLSLCSALTTERDALMALYDATNGVNWKRKAKWGSDKPVGAWHGVSTDENGRVIRLELSGNRLRGEIPAALGKLTNLQHLDLSGNGLSGEIPAALGQLTNLGHLDLGHNGLRGEIPAALGQLTNLRNLYLRGNGLRGEIPAALGQLTNLWDLDLSGNGLRGEIPAALGQLTNLQYLVLGHNRLRGEIPAQLGNLTKLKWLDLRVNRLRGEIPAQLGNLTNLKYLNLYKNQLTGAIPAALGNLTKLANLYLADNQLSGCEPDGLRQVTTNDLDSLALPLCSAWAEAVAADRAALMALYNATNGAGWTTKTNWDSEQPLSAWHGVTTNDNGRVTGLDLRSNGLSGAIPAALGQLSNLEHLYLSGNSLSGCEPDGLRQVATNDLDSLALPLCSALAEAVAAERAALMALYNATNGAVGWTTKTNWDSEQPLSAWHGVTTDENGRVTGLDLRSNGLSGAIPAELGQLSNLESLHLGGNSLSGCEPDGLRQVATNDLDSLALPLCSALTAEAVAADRAALMALYNAMNGANWKRKTNWGSEQPLSAWHGVSTDENGRVVSLNLRSNGLRGAIPVELGNLTNLRALSLADNSLNGAIPVELGKLTNLEWLYLRGNSLRGCVLDDLHKKVSIHDLDELSLPLCSALAAEKTVLIALYDATNGPSWTDKTNWGSEQPLSDWHGVATDENGRVTGLNLRSNELRGAIPVELGNLSNLRALSLADNSLNGVIPAELGKLTNLKWLYLRGNELSGEIPAALGNLTNLVELYLGTNQLSGEIPAALGNLTNLTALSLSGNELTGCIPDGLRNIAHSDLSNLDISFCSALAEERAAERTALIALYNATNGANWKRKTNWGSDEPLSAWHGIFTNDNGRVTSLDLSKNQLSGTIPAALDKLTELRTLYLSGNELTGCVPDGLREVANNDLDSLGGLPLCSALATERAALIALYDATDGASWTNKINWSSSDKPVGDWLGVVTDANGSVTALYLRRNGLSGEIPAELGDLSNLTRLDLGSNQLSGEIPAELGDLSNLTALLLDNNQLSGEIPAELGKLSNLTGLGLSDNQLSGEIPAELGDLSNLTGLVLSNNGLSGEIPSELGKLSNLTTLGLSNNRLSGEIPAELGDLSNLTALGLSDNGLSGEIPAELEDLTGLQYLFLSGNSLSGCVPGVLRQVANNDLDSLDLPLCSAVLAAERAALIALYKATNGAGWTNKTNWDSDEPVSDWHGVTTDDNGRVTKLELNSNRLSGGVPAAQLGNLSKLTALDLGANRLGGGIPAELGKLTNLTILILSSNRLNGTIPSELGQLTNLEWLYLQTNRLNGAIPSELGQLTKLKGLRLIGNSLSGEIPSELGQLTNLVELYLSRNSLSGCIPAGLSNVAANDLEKLSLPLCSALAADRAALIALYKATNGAGWTNKANWLSAEPVGEWYGITTDARGRVTALDLNSNQLSGVIPAELGNLSKLTALDLYNNQLSGEIPAELGQLSDLRELDLGASVLDGVIPAELGQLTNLTILNLSSNSLSGEIPAALGQLTNLVELYLSRNSLSGCIPAGLSNVAANDLEKLSLPLCSAPRQ